MLAEYSFALTLLLLVILERVLNAFSLLIVALVWGSSSTGGSTLKGYAGTQLVGAGFTFGTSLLSSVFSCVAGLLTALASYAIWMALAFLVFSILFVVQEQYSFLLIQLVDAWNSTYGSIVYEFVFFPLHVANTLFISLVPIYNGLIWLLKLLVQNVLLRSAMDNADHVISIGTSMGNLARHTIVQVPSYAQSVIVPCAQPVTDTCYDLGFGNRIFDFITPMADVRAIAAAFLRILISVCGNAAGPADIFLYPLLDINLAKAVHNLGNAVLFSFLQLPSITVQRCNNNNRDLITCLPDFEPAFNMLVAGNHVVSLSTCVLFRWFFFHTLLRARAGTRNLGLLLDNWLDVSSIIVQKSLGIDPRADCEAQAQLLAPAAYSRAVFGTSRTIVVGLTRGLYAVTDGRHAQYFNHYDSIESTIATNAWPIDVDVRYGIAAVTHMVKQRDGTTGESTTTMMGCQCLDNNGLPPMRIRCALALKEKIALQSPEENVFEVVFHQRSTAKYMSCATSQISVQSVRWPATRFVSTDAPVVSSRRSVVDATVWVAPLCAARATKVPEVCVPMFKAAACYPYCMAARLQGSGANGLVLYNANEWRDRVHLMNRDCNKQQTALDPLGTVGSGNAMFLPSGTQSKDQFSLDSTVESSAAAPGLGDGLSAVVVQKWDAASGGCVQASSAWSRVGNQVYQTVSKKNVQRSILMPGQPFAYSGDVTLTAVQLNSGEYVVAVDRLYGSEANEFSMVNVLQEFPANPPADTPRMGSEIKYQLDRLPIPYAFSDMAGVQHPAVSTGSSVFFAVNPSLAMFKCFAKGCATQGYEWCTQLSALSSYAPIRVWKIDPFAYCPHGNDGTANCGIGRVHFADVEGAFTDVKVQVQQEGDLEQTSVFDIRKCGVPFAVSVTGLEYINDENIAVTILWASFDEYDPFTGQLYPTATKAHSKILFLSTETMAWSETPWSREAQLSSATEGMLCPAMRRLPNLGSLSTEVAVAGIELLRKVVDVGISLPGLIQIWGNQQSCPLVTHGHSLLQRCGSDLLSLDDFFDAMNRANAHFWRSFSLVAERIRDIDEDNLANIVEGVAYYGESTVSPLDAYKSTVATIRIPTQELGDQFIQGVLPMADRAMANEMAISANPMRMAQFSYDLITSIVSDIIPLAIRASKESRDKEVVREILAVFNNKLYQAREAYYGAITLGMMQARPFFLSGFYCITWHKIIENQRWHMRDEHPAQDD